MRDEIVSRWKFYDNYYEDEFRINFYENHLGITSSSSFLNRDFDFYCNISEIKQLYNALINIPELIKTAVTNDFGDMKLFELKQQSNHYGYYSAIILYSNKDNNNIEIRIWDGNYQLSHGKKFTTDELQALINKINEVYGMDAKNMNENQNVDSFVIETKTFRKELDEILQKIKNSERLSNERSIAITKIQEAIMWLGMDLKDLGENNPYPNSKNPENTIIEKTADGLIL